jgi:hypothetical protein
MLGPRENEEESRDKKEIVSDECMWVENMKSPVVVQGDHRGDRMSHYPVHEV